MLYFFCLILLVTYTKEKVQLVGYYGMWRCASCITACGMKIDPQCFGWKLTGINAVLGIFLQVLSVLNLLEIRQCLLHYILEVKPNSLHNSYNSKPRNNSLWIIYRQFCYQIITMEGDDVPPALQLVARYNVFDESWPRLGIKWLTCRSWLQIQNSWVGSWHVFVI